MSIKGSDLPKIRDARVQDFESWGRDIYALNTSYVSHHRQWKDRIRRLDRVMDNKWPIKYDDNAAREEEAKIADMITSDLHDVGLLAGDIEPTVVCDPQVKKGQSTDKAQDRALLRQQILTNHRRRSGLAMKRVRLAMDLAGAGAGCLVVWPDRYGPQEERFPQYHWKDPRYIFPDPDCKDGLDLLNMTISYRVKGRALAADYPDVLSRIYTAQELKYNPKEADNRELEVIEFHGPGESLKMVGLNRSQGARKDLRTTVLDGFTHDLGKPLAIMGMRPSFDGQLRGQFDTSIGPLQSANLLFHLMLDQMGRFVYAMELWTGQFDNPDDAGAGARIRGELGAKIERVAPDAVNPQIFAMYNTLKSESQLAAGVSSARHGDVSQSIISAQGVDRLQGKQTTQVAAYQEIIADMEERANALALEVDEKMLGGVEKSIAGTVEGGSFQRTYEPKRDIAGVYQNRVEFGAMASMDRFNRSVQVQGQVAGGIISERRARSELLTDVDIDAEARQIAKEQIEKGVIAGLQQPTTPETWLTQVQMRLRAAELLDKGKTVGEMSAELMEEFGQAPTAEPPAPGNPMEESLSMLKGGIPGNAEDAPPAAYPRLAEAGIRRPA